MQVLNLSCPPKTQKFKQNMFFPEYVKIKNYSYQNNCFSDYFSFYAYPCITIMKFSVKEPLGSIRHKRFNQPDSEHKVHWDIKTPQKHYLLLFCQPSPFKLANCPSNPPFQAIPPYILADIFPSTFLHPINGSKNSILNWLMKLNLFMCFFFFFCFLKHCRPWKIFHSIHLVFLFFGLVTYKHA